MAVLKDFSVLVPEPVTVKIGSGEDVQEIDLTIFPAFVSLKMSEFVTGRKITDIRMGETTAFLADTLGRLNPAITQNFLEMKCTEQQVGEVFVYLLDRHTEERTRGLKKVMGKKTDKKNP